MFDRSVWAKKAKKNNKKPIFDSGSRVKGSLPAIFSAKSNMDDLCPFLPGVRCEGSIVQGRLK